MTYKLPLAAAAMLLTASLGACSPSAEAPTHGENYTDTRAEPTDEPMPTAPPTAIPDVAPTRTADSNMTAAALPESAPSAAPDEQLMDDASATGMTARTSRAEPTTSATSPAEPVEQK